MLHIYIYFVRRLRFPGLGFSSFLPDSSSSASSRHLFTIFCTRLLECILRLCGTALAAGDPPKCVLMFVCWPSVLHSFPVSNYIANAYWKERLTFRLFISRMTGTKTSSAFCSDQENDDLKNRRSVSNCGVPHSNCCCESSTVGW